MMNEISYSFNITEGEEEAGTHFCEGWFRYTTHTGLATSKLKQLKINDETKI